MRHNRAQIRKERIRHIKRKERILKSYYSSEEYEKYHSSLKAGKLSKGKIHCGCPLCKPYKHHYYESATNQKKLDKFNRKMDDYIEDESRDAGQNPDS